MWGPEDRDTQRPRGDVAVAREDVARTLRQLEALKAAGVVDDVEYADQRARILAAP